jgi:hypothetical protein
MEEPFYETLNKRDAILKFILKKQGVTVRTQFYWLRISPLKGFLSLVMNLYVP